LKTHTSDNNPLIGYDVQRLIMAGYSQSAAYQVTYANSFHDAARMPDGSSVYDGYYVAAGGGLAKHVTGPRGSNSESLPPGDSRNLIRVDVPVIRFQTETEVPRAHLVRQWKADFPLVRFYEMAGGSHVDSHLDFVAGRALVRDLGIPSSFCPNSVKPLNPIRIGFVQSALMESLENWIAKGKFPPESRFIQLELKDWSTVMMVRDELGNVLGGIRPPEIQIPIGTYEGTNAGPGFCRLYGAFTAWDSDTLKERYQTHDLYLNQLTKAVNHSLQQGFLLQEDTELQIKAAMQSAIGDE